jgi:hypothetical protein
MLFWREFQGKEKGSSCVDEMNHPGLNMNLCLKSLNSWTDSYAAIILACTFIDYIPRSLARVCMNWLLYSSSGRCCTNSA